MLGRERCVWDTSSNGVPAEGLGGWWGGAWSFVKWYGGGQVGGVAHTCVLGWFGGPGKSASLVGKNPQGQRV